MMTINVSYGPDWSIRKWITTAGRRFEIETTKDKIGFVGTIVSETDIDTFRAQINNAIQDWRQIKAGKRPND